jgi:hypothetical protein
MHLLISPDADLTAIVELYQIQMRGREWNMTRQAVKNIKAVIRAPLKNSAAPASVCATSTNVVKPSPAQKRKCICTIPQGAHKANHEPMKLMRFLIFRR